MWTRARTLLKELTAIDRRFAAFGSSYHQYYLGSRVSEARMLQVEARLGVRLPEELRSFYRHFGNGGVGPHYGVTPLGLLRAELSPAEPYPGLAALREAAIRAGNGPNADGYFEAPRAAIVGLLGFCGEGCGHETCVVVSGPRAGLLVSVSLDGMVNEIEASLPRWYEAWCEEQLARFHLIREAMDRGDSREQIDRAAWAIGTYNPYDYAASIADLESPPLYSGAAQNAWFDEVLRIYRERRGSSQAS